MSFSLFADRFWFLAVMLSLAVTPLLAVPAVGDEEVTEEVPDGEMLVQDNCLVCHRADNENYPNHNLGWILHKRYTKAEWLDNVDRMEKIALRDDYISDPWPAIDKDAMADYLTKETAVELSDRERLGMMHYSVVHFPVALIFILGFFELIGMALGWPMRRDLLHGLAWLALISSAVAAGLGLVLAWNISTLSETLMDHRNAGLSSFGLMVLAVAFREIAVSTQRGWATWAYRICLLVAMAAVGAAGHLGGTLVHGEFLPFAAQTS